MISANKMENAIWNAISQTITRPQILIPHILHLAKNIARSRETLENKKDKIIELYTEGAITKEQLTRKMQEYNQKIEEKLRETKANLSQIIHRPFLIKDILNFCKIASERSKP